MKIDYTGIFFLVLGIGSLQVILDLGQRKEWFESDFISWLAIISVTSLAIFIIVELFLAEHPVVNLRLFKNISFSTGNIVMFFTFFITDCP